MAEAAHLWIVTGLSGAGKTQAMKALEDLGFFCIDNLPPALLPPLTRLDQFALDPTRRVAVAMDVRGAALFTDLLGAVDALVAAGVPHRILFLDCSDAVLVRRYAESRRRHPIADGRSLVEQIDAERRLLDGVRRRADHLLDTSRMTNHELKVRLGQLTLGRKAAGLDVDVMSFGFKHGVPLDADLMFDARFLPNPYYDEALRPLTGLDAPVIAFVLGNEGALAYLAELTALLQRWLPAYAESGRARLTVAIGCTGGQHRSVVLAAALAARLLERFPDVHTLHRDVHRAPPPGGV
jgi:UPF0042 nucleotide-binding protein